MPEMKKTKVYTDMSIEYYKDVHKVCAHKIVIPRYTEEVL